MLLAIDPGTDLGWALFGPDRRLSRCGFGTPPREGFEEAVIERPKIYPQGRQKANPKDVITLALTAGEFGGRCKDANATVRYVEPDEWKGGSIPKEIHQPRIWAKLTDAEKSVLDVACKGMAPSKRHNVVDAVGIGLWGVGRRA